MGKNAQNQVVLKKRLWPIGPSSAPEELKLRRTARREFSSGGVIFKGGEWLITRSSKSELYPKTYWRLPKGWIDNVTPEIPGPMARGKIKADEESLQKNALREVREEGGVEARIIKKIGTAKYFYSAPDKGRILKFVTFYLMEYVRDLPEGFDAETSEIVWLPFEEALETLSFRGEKQILKKAKDGLP